MSIVRSPELLHLVGCGVAYVVDGVMVLALKELYLEGKDGEELVHIAPDIPDAVFLPCPYLGRNIVTDRYLGMAVKIGGNVEIEARIVDQYHRIGLPPYDVALATAHVAENGWQMEQDGNETHICQLAIVSDRLTSLCRHQVATEETEFCLRVALPEGTHQTRGMEVAARLTGYQIVFHKPQLFISSIIP